MAKFVDDLGGPRRAFILGTVLLLSLALLIAGGITLGIGINKLNNSKSGSDAKPVSFFVNLQHDDFTNDVLRNSFDDTAKAFRDQVINAVGKNPNVLLLSLTSGNDDSLAKSLFSVSYTSKFAPDNKALQKSLEDKKFKVNKLVDNKYTLKSDDQICSVRNDNSDQTDPTGGTQPPNTDPSEGTQPPQTNPPQTDPPQTDPPQTEPPKTKPPKQDTTYKPPTLPTHPTKGTPDPTRATRKPDPGYKPCDGAVYVFFDGGVQVSATAFKNTKNFISDKLFVGFTHFERLIVGEYTTLLMPHEHKEDSVFEDIKKELEKVDKSQRESSLRSAMHELVTEFIDRDHDKQHSYVLFVGKTGNDVIEEAKEWAVTLNKSGKLTLISISKENDIAKLKELTDNVLEWDAEANGVPNDYENVFLTAFGCKKNVMDIVRRKRAVIQRAAEVSKVLANVADDDYTPCKGQITMLFDTSAGLLTPQFDSLKKFIDNNIFTNWKWNHLERLVLGYYNEYPILETLGVFDNLQEIKNYVKALTQSTAQPNLRRVFVEIVEGLHPEILEFNLNYIIFVSKIDRTTVDEIKPYVGTFSHRKVTFVAMNGVDIPLLKEIGYDVIEWKTNENSPSNWEGALWTAFGCNSAPPTKPTLPPTEPTQPPEPTDPTQTPRPTRGTPRPTPSPDLPYLPCKKDVIIVVDSSNNLKPADFKAQNRVVISELFKEFTHFERLSLGHFDDYPIITAPKTFPDKIAAEDFLNRMQQASGSGSVPLLRSLYSELEAQLEGKLNQDVSIIVFTSFIDQDSVDQAEEQFDEIKRTGAKVSLIGTNMNVDQELLKKLSHFAFRFDVSSPTNGDNALLQQAFQCPS